MLRIEGFHQMMSFDEFQMIVSIGYIMQGSGL